jgi:large repetitive protein
MTKRRVAMILLVACAAVVVAGFAVRLSSAAFTAQTPVAGNTVTVDTLGNYFQVTPGAAVVANTSTPAASGGVDTLTLAFALVPSARVFTSVFTVKNVSAQPRTAVLTLSGPAQVGSAVFASTGTATATLAAGSSTTVTVTTSSTIAGHGAGSLRLGLSTLGWMYRTYPLTLDEAPEAPPSLTATQRPAGRIDLAWGASATTTNLRGYDVYRRTGAGSYTKLDASPLTGLTYPDTTTTDGTTYTYKVTAVSTDAAPLTSLDSPPATQTADATPPARPSSVSAGAWITTAASVDVTLSSGSLASDTVTVTLSDGTHAVTRTTAASAGSGTVTVSGLDASALSDGTVAVTATSTDRAGNVSTQRSTTVTKDTVAPSTPWNLAYTDRNNGSADRVGGSCDSGSTVEVVQTSPSGAGTFTGSCSGGSFTINVSAQKDTAVSFSVSASDPAGNTSGAATLTATDTK